MNHGYLQNPMLIHTYDPAWPQAFMRIKDTVNAQFSALEFRMEHVGSTSVPGLAAKPIIDIDIVYEDDTRFAVLKQGLAALGYVHNGDQGIPEREVFKRAADREEHPVLDAVRHHLYACPAASGELQRHLLFRNYLRDYSWARDEYAELKMAIAHEAGEDHSAYAVLKETLARAFVFKILGMAGVS